MTTDMSRRLSRDSISAPRQVFNDGLLDTICEAVYELCCARGLKHVAKALPHAVRDLEAVYVTLTSLDDHLHDSLWRTRYTLLLWLGMLMLNPFNVDSITEDGVSFVAGVVLHCSETLNDAGPPRDAAAFCLSVTLTRRDVCASHLKSFVDLATNLVFELGKPDSKPIFAAAGALTALAAAFKRGDRVRLAALARITFEGVRLCFGDSNSAFRPLKQLAVKLAGRVGVALLKPRIASWCYTRGKRTLMMSDVPPPSILPSGVAEGGESNVEVEAEDAEEVLEAVVDALLVGLRECETKTRWSAAKGIGRIASRLPRSIADDVVEGVLSVFDDQGSHDDDNAWHGSCLALAELSRLGVLLPSRLSAAFSALSAALKYDRQRGNHSIGANVRDAACYVAWAFARAYAPQIISPHLPALVDRILTVAVYDREVHVRRAAGAALQENVGRQGMKMYGSGGIKLIQVADFLALGNRERAHLDVASSVAKLGFWQPLFDHLLEDRYRHWDPQVRALTARSLGELVRLLEHSQSRLDAARTVVTTLAPLAAGSRELAARHGALLALAEVAAFVLKDEAVVSELSDIVPRIEAARLYRGRGGELVRSAACALIESLALNRTPLPIKVQLRLLDTLDECSSHAVEAVRLAAMKGVKALTWTYFGGFHNFAKTMTKPSERLLARTVLRYTGLARKPTTPDVSRGACRCLGALPVRLLAADDATLDAVLQILIFRARRDDTVAGEKDAETRRDALAALKDLIRTVGAPYLTRIRVLQLHNCFVTNACSDFSVDKRGDVGSWSRIKGLEAATELVSVLTVFSDDADSIGSTIPALGERTAWLSSSDSLSFLVAETPYMGFDSRARWTAVESEQFCCALLRHLGEKLDAVRNVALRLMPILLKVAPAIPKRSEIDDALSLGRMATIDLPTRLCTCLALGGAYHDAVFGGLFVSAGSSDSQSGERYKAALINYAVAATKVKDISDTTRLANALISCAYSLRGSKPPKLSDEVYFKGFNAEERSRSFVPLMKCLTALLDGGAFLPLLTADGSRKLKSSGSVLSISEAIAANCIGPDEDEAFARNLVSALTAIAATPRCTRDVRKICVAADALLAALNAAAVNAPTAAGLALAAITRSLLSPYPRARAHIAEQFYATLVELTIVDGCFLAPGSLAAAQELLETVTWETEECSDAIYGTVLNLAGTLGIEPKDIQSRCIAKSMLKPKDELESYAHLVKDAGY